MKPLRPGRPRFHAARSQGFGLLELLLALALGLSLGGLMLQALVGEEANGWRLGRLLRERAFQRRTLELLRAEVARSVAVSVEPALESSPCGWAGRRPLLHLRLASGGVITYAVGAPPDRIWRGQVLMRCGPAYDLDGEPGSSGWQNRVVLDGLATSAPTWGDCGGLLPTGAGRSPAGADRAGLSVCLDAAGGQVALRLQQAFPLPGGRQQTITSMASASLTAAIGSGR